MSATLACVDGFLNLTRAVGLLGPILDVMSAHVMALQWSSRNRPTATKKRFRNVDFLDAVTGSPQRTLAYDDDDGRRRRGYSCATIGFNDNEHTDTFLYMYIYIHISLPRAHAIHIYGKEALRVSRR